MLRQTVKSVAGKLLTTPNRYGLLDHKEMETLKTKVFSDREKTLLLKTKFLLKEAKYTIVQGSKDLWHDKNWIINLYKKKEKSEFTGYELAETQRIKVDMIKFIPYSVILTVPFAELCLPFILWLFPNAVPSFYLFDTAWDQLIEKFEQTQFESHKILIDKLTDVMTQKFGIDTFEFSKEEFFKGGFFEIIDELDQHLDYNKFTSDELLKVLEFMGGGDFITGVETFNKVVNLFTRDIPRLVVKLLRWLYATVTRKTLEPYQDPWFVKGYFDIFKFNYFPFEPLKCRFLIWQIDRKFRMISEQDRAFEKFGMDDIVGSNIKSFARERGLATLSCY